MTSSANSETGRSGNWKPNTDFLLRQNHGPKNSFFVVVKTNSMKKLLHLNS